MRLFDRREEELLGAEGLAASLVVLGVTAPTAGPSPELLAAKVLEPTPSIEATGPFAVECGEPSGLRAGDWAAEIAAEFEATPALAVGRAFGEELPPEAPLELPVPIQT